MNSSCSVLPFDELPTEIIWHIFAYLDLDTLKSVSLTSRRLERIFSSYSCFRFTLFIDDSSRLNLPGDTYVSHGFMESIAKTLRHSKRYYQKVHLPVQLYSVLSKELEPNWLQQLVVLNLTMGHDLQNYITQITVALPKMDYLQELKFIKIRGTPSAEHFIELKIENGSLQRLVLEVMLPSVINCPKLRKLDVGAQLDADTQFGEQYAQYDGQEPYWKLKQLEEFRITKHKSIGRRILMQHSPEFKFKFYQHLTQLKKLHFYEPPVSEKFLQIICESCLHLEDLFITFLQVIDSNSLCCLSNLPDLRRLGIWQNNTQELSFASVNAPKLENLTLGPVNVVWESLEQLQSVKSLCIRMNNFVNRPIPLSFAKRMKQLEFLWIDFFFFANPKIQRKMFQVLEELTHLKTLILDHLVQREHSPLIPPLPQVKRLILYKCYLNRDSTFVAGRFPNVKQVELKVPKCFTWDYEESLYEEIFRLRNHSLVLPSTRCVDSD
uniref:F-box domain-containing protein n=1 Tax=Anopheles funestus TaxID=62324 RepID=A0A182R4F4_ANOFN